MVVSYYKEFRDSVGAGNDISRFFSLCLRYNCILESWWRCDRNAPNISVQRSFSFRPFSAWFASCWRCAWGEIVTQYAGRSSDVEPIRIIPLNSQVLPSRISVTNEARWQRVGDIVNCIPTKLNLPWINNKNNLISPSPKANLQLPPHSPRLPTINYPKTSWKTVTFRSWRHEMNWIVVCRRPTALAHTKNICYTNFCSSFSKPIHNFRIGRKRQEFHFFF